MTAVSGWLSTARTTETTYRFTQLALGNDRLTVRAVNAWAQQGDPASGTVPDCRTCRRRRGLS